MALARTSTRLVAALLAACASMACGGEDAGRLEGNSLDNEAPPEPCAVAETYSFELIEDFEDGSANDWYISSDMTDGSVVAPSPQASPPLPSTELDEPRCGESMRALNITATGLLDFGGSFGLQFFPGTTSTPFDASGYDGLSFWARREPNSQGSSLLASVADKYTDQGGGALVEGDERETLIEVPGQADPMDEEKPLLAYCRFEAPVDTIKCDRFGAGVGLETEWRFFAIRFDEMAQQGFGKPSVLDGPDTDELTGINIGFEAGDWDFWVDDFAFFTDPE